jgi:hypothetical protein
MTCVTDCMSPEPLDYIIILCDFVPSRHKTPGSLLKGKIFALPYSPTYFQSLEVLAIRTGREMEREASSNPPVLDIG